MRDLPRDGHLDGQSVSHLELGFRRHVAPIRRHVERALDHGVGVPGVDGQSRREDVEPLPDVHGDAQLPQVPADDGLAHVFVGVAGHAERDRRGEGGGAVQQVEPGGQAEVLQALLPAVAAVDGLHHRRFGNAGRRPRPEVLREDERHTRRHGKPVSDRVVALQVDRGVAALPDRLGRAVGQDVTGVVDPWKAIVIAPCPAGGAQACANAGGAASTPTRTTPAAAATALVIR